VEQPTREPEAVPGYKNYLVYCDESGQSGKLYYGFGSLWMPWERRGDFAALISETKARHDYDHELKWNKVARRTVPICKDLIEQFFRRNWLMFHGVVIRKGYVDRQYHKGGHDEALRKHFAMLIKSKIHFFSDRQRTKMYHVVVDPLPSRYKKADEAAHIIINNQLMQELDFKAVHSVVTRDSKHTPGIQLADLLLGAAMADWNNEAIGEHKAAVKDWVAAHIGWRHLRADTWKTEWKFNVWYFYDPTTGRDREVQTWDTNFKYRVPVYRGRRR
jgi:Protein of unknown function (DUF3800)